MTAGFNRLFLVMIALATPSLGADRLIDYVSPSLLQNSTGCTNYVAAHLPVTRTQIQAVATLPPRPVGAAERWERFETEFSIKQHSSSLMLGSLQNAKYQLDKTTFTMQEWMNDIEESLSFDYGLKDLGLPVSAPKSYRSMRSHSFAEALQGVRLKSDINLNVASASYVGVKLVFPLGN